jgi:hypothetical protein
MKNIILIILILFFPLSLICAEESYISWQDKHGFYMTIPDLKFSSINGSTAFGLGLRTGWIINHSFSIGFAGNMFLTNIHANPPDGSIYGIGYMGLITEYIFEPHQKYHVTLSTLVGIGMLGPWNLYTDSNGEYYSGRFISSFDADGFTLIEPEIDIFMNLVSCFKVGAGVSYRIVSNIELYGFNNQDISGFTFNLIFKLGIF